MKESLQKWMIRTVPLIGSLAALAYLLHAAQAYAAEPTVQDTLNGKGSGVGAEATAQSVANPGWSAVVNTLLALAILLVLLYVVLKLLKRSIDRNRFSAGIQIVAQQALTTNRSVHVVEIGGKLYLLGVGENVTLLDIIEHPDVVRQIRDSVQNDGSTRDITLNAIIPFRFWNRKRNTEELDPGFKETLERQLQSMRQLQKSLDNSISHRRNDESDEEVGTT
jgi:flagellar protein FliO/FliZ